MLYVENPKKSSRNALELINVKISGYKLSVKKSTVLVYNDNEQ